MIGRSVIDVGSVADPSAEPLLTGRYIILWIALVCVERLRERIVGQFGVEAALRRQLAIPPAIRAKPTWREARGYAREAESAMSLCRLAADVVRICKLRRRDLGFLAVIRPSTCGP